jgi:hypothetical protein
MSASGEIYEKVVRAVNINRPTKIGPAGSKRPLDGSAPIDRYPITNEIFFIYRAG